MRFLCTLGFGTSHKVNNILLQPGKFADATTRSSPKRKRSRRSFKLPDRGFFRPYEAGKRIGPEPLKFYENDAREFMIADQEVLSRLWIMCRKMSVPQAIPSWTGFHMSVRNNIAVATTAIGYLDCIDSSASDISTINQVLHRCIKIKVSLNLPSIVCVFDEAIYAKAVEIKWKSPDIFKSCVIMLGIFHTLMMYLGIIGKRFGDGGYRDILVQSEVVAEGSVERTLSGKMYNRSVRAVKLTYEALSRILLDKFIGDMKEDDITDFNQIEEDINDFSKDLGEDALNEIMEKDTFKNFNKDYIDFIDTIKDSGGELAVYWLSFIEMTQILLNIIFATRSGNWELLIESLRDVVPYAFAYDNINYARYLTTMLGEMLQLEDTHPEVYRSFMDGNFSVQLSDRNTFGRIEPDKCIEMTINKDTKTPGGTTGFSTNPNSIIRWSINATYRAELRKKMHEFASYKKQKFLHKDLNPSRIMKDEKDVNAIIDVLSNTFTSPFSDNPLLCISNGILAMDEVASDTKNALSKGDYVFMS